MGCVVPILQIDEKKHHLYRKSWRTLKDLNDEEYLQCKEERTGQDDKGDIIPNSISTVSFFFILSISHHWASEASTTLGCSIEISRDIYIGVCLSYVK